MDGSDYQAKCRGPRPKECLNGVIFLEKKLRQGGLMWRDTETIQDQKIILLALGNFAGIMVKPLIEQSKCWCLSVVGVL